MARIAGVDLPREKRVEIALTYIYGIGRSIADEIIEATGVNPDTRVKDLTEADVGKLRDYIDQNRAVSPLRQAEDALLLDNSNLTIEEQKQWLAEQFQKAVNGKH